MALKTILFLLNRECTYLPPFMAILDSLCGEYALKVISYETSGGKEDLEKMYQDKNVVFLSSVLQDNQVTFICRLKRKLRRCLRIQSEWHREAVKLIESTHYDLLWVVNETTAVEYAKELRREKYVLNIFELYDIVPSFLKELKPLAQRAHAVIVPEYNRACMLKFWLQLDRIPRVIPNKPVFHPGKINIDNDWSNQLIGKKILLYQGYINRNRNVEAICRAVEGISGWTMVLMGKGENDYLEYLKSNYPHLIHIGYINPPHHLDITSWARIGVVKYDWFDLNHVYCAPNKTWEYAGFGIPMIGNELPGLRYSIGQFKAGVLADLDDPETIKEAIAEIDSHYDEYRNNAQQFYNSCSVELLIRSVAKDNC